MSDFFKHTDYIVERGNEWVGLNQKGVEVTPRCESRYFLMRLCYAKRLKKVGEKNGSPIFVPICDFNAYKESSTMVDEENLDNDNKFDILIEDQGMTRQKEPTKK